MIHGIKQLVITSLIIAASVCTSLAGPPFRTDDPIAVPFHHGEFYFFTTGVSDNEGIEGIGPAVELNYSAIPHTMFHVIIPMAFSAPRGKKNQFGFGDMELGFKYQFISQTRRRPAVGTFPLIEVPTGNASENLGGGYLQAFIPLWIQKDFGSWTFYGGGGYWLNPGSGNKNWEFTGLLAQYNFSDAFFLGMELFHQTPASVGATGRTGLHFGGGIPLAQNTQILFSTDAGNVVSNYEHTSFYVAYYHTF